MTLPKNYRRRSLRERGLHTVCGLVFGFVVAALIGFISAGTAAFAGRLNIDQQLPYPRIMEMLGFSGMISSPTDFLLIFGVLGAFPVAIIGAIAGGIEGMRLGSAGHYPDKIGVALLLIVTSAAAFFSAVMGGVALGSPSEFSTLFHQGPMWGIISALFLAPVLWWQCPRLLRFLSTRRSAETAAGTTS